MISDFRLWRYELPLKAPVSLKKGSTMSVREGLLLELVANNGESFWGEAAPLPGFSRESLEEAARELARVAEKLAREGHRCAGSRPVSGLASVDFAVGMAVSQCENFDDPGTPNRSIAVCGLLSGSREEILSDAAKLRKNGYEAVKLKVGRGAGVEGDVVLVSEVREVLGDDVALRLDANRAWSFEGAHRFAGLVSDAGIEFIEEPLEEPGRLLELSEATGLPVALDESLVEMAADEARSHDYARAFVLKPSLLGYSRTASFASIARDFGAKAIISSSYESGVGMLGLVRLATFVGRGAAGLDTHRRFVEDLVCSHLDLSGPRLNLREIFGDIEREVDYEKLERIA
ncbi:MAG: o-succinylbenzoate synthase [Rubrobacteraceae bacterium]